MSSSVKPSPDSVIIRTIKESELEEVCKLIRTEDWFITMEKLTIAFREGLATFYILEDVKDHQILGAMNVTPTRPDEASLGNVIIQPGFRGRGLGKYFLLHVLGLYPKSTLTWFSEADPFYEKLGAKIFGQFGVYVELDLNRDMINDYCNANVSQGVTTTPFTNDRFEDLHQYDLEARGYDNRPYLTITTRASDHTILAVKEVDDKRIVGWASSWDDKGILRFNGFYADDDHIAALLLRETLNRYPTLNVVKYLSIDDRKFLLRFGKSKMEAQLNRAAYGRDPAYIPLTKLYALTDPDMSY